jgi:hypothetical protein
MDKKFVSIRSQYYKRSQAIGLIGHIERLFKNNKNVLPDEQIEFDNVSGTLDELSDEEIINEMNKLHSENDELSDKDKKKKRNKFILDKKDILFENITDNKITENFKKYSKLAEEQYRKKNNNRSFKKEANLYIEFVVNFSQEYFFTQYPQNQEQIIKDMENLIKDIENKYKIKGLGFSLHLDEGYKKKDGTIIYNPHFHLSFLNYDFENNVSPWRNLKRSDFKNFQDLAFDNFKNLGFERGISKEITNATNKSKEQIIFEKINKLEEDISILDNEEKLISKKITDLNVDLKNNNNLISNVDIFLKKVIDGQISLDEIEILKKKNNKFKIVHTALTYAYRYLNNLADEKKKEENLITLQNKLNEFTDKETEQLTKITELDKEIENKEELEIKLNETIKLKEEAVKNLDEYLLNEKNNIVNIKNNAENVLNKINNEIDTQNKKKKDNDIILNNQKSEYETISRISNFPKIPEMVKDILKTEIDNNKNFMGQLNEDKFLSNTNDKIYNVVKSVIKGEDNPLIEKNQVLLSELKRKDLKINDLEAEIKPLRRLERINSNNVDLNTQNDALRVEIQSKNQIIQSKDEELKEIKSFLNQIVHNFPDKFIKSIQNILPKSLQSIFKPKKSGAGGLDNDIEMK